MKFHFPRKFLIPIILLILFTIYFYWKNPLITKVIINSQTIYVDVAVTNPQKELGLGYRVSMPTDHGMLFVYDHREAYGFWMKGMNFPLDFIWIDGNTIKDITEDVPVYKNGTYSTINPKTPVDKILEVNAGTIKRLHIKPGDKVIFKM